MSPGSLGSDARSFLGDHSIVTNMIPFDNAARAERLGVRLVVSRERYAAKSAATALKRLLGTPSFARKASDIGRWVQSEDGIAVACAAIEQLLSRSSVPRPKPTRSAEHPQRALPVALFTGRAREAKWGLVMVACAGPGNLRGQGWSPASPR